VVIAHRGAATSLPEHTLEAYRPAIAVDVDTSNGAFSDATDTANTALQARERPAVESLRRSPVSVESLLSERPPAEQRRRGVKGCAVR